MREVARGLWKGAQFAGWVAWWMLEARLVARRSLRERSRWRQRQCAQLVRLLRVDVQVEGPVPTAGLVVANHLGYIDVIVLGSLLPCVFVSKAEVAGWPVFGLLTRTAGTIYVQRESMRSAAQVAREMAAMLSLGELLTVFPEGTSSAGDGVLPFQAPLFDAAVRSGSPVLPVALGYEIPAREGKAAEQVAYWGDMTLGPHLLGMLRLSRIEARVRFAAAPVNGAGRRELAAAAQNAVGALLDRLPNGR